MGLSQVAPSQEVLQAAELRRRQLESAQSRPVEANWGEFYFCLGIHVAVKLVVKGAIVSSVHHLWCVFEHAVSAMRRRARFLLIVVEEVRDLGLAVLVLLIVLATT
jgi:hypothetical protein